MLNHIFLSGLYIFSAVSTTTSVGPLVYVLAALAGGGLLTGIVGYLRLRKQGTAEKEEIITRAAEQAVNALQISLTKLENELQRAQVEKEEIMTQLSSAKSRRDELEEKVRIITNRIQDLEDSIIGYRNKESFIKTVTGSYDGILLIKLGTGYIEYANPAAHLMFEYPPNTLSNGTRLRDLVSENQRAQLRQIKNELLSNPVEMFINDKIPDIVGLKATGSTFHVLIKIAPLENQLAIVTLREVH